MSERKCPGCHGVPESENHDCLKSLTSRVSRHKCELLQLVELQKTANHDLSSQVQYLGEGLQILKREKDNEIKDLQYQLEELKTSLSEVQHEARNMFLAKTTIDRAAQEADFDIAHARKAEIAPEISEDQQDEGEISSSQDSQKTQLLSDLSKSPEPDQVEQEPLEDRIRTFRRQHGPMLDLGTQQIDLGRGKIQVKSKRVKIQPSPVAGSSKECQTDPEETKKFQDSEVQVTILPEESKEPESPELIITSNNLNTQGLAPSENLRVAIEYQGRLKKILIPKDMTTRAFRAHVKDLLKIPGDLHLNMVYVTHRVIEDDDKTMWSMGLRHINNHIAVIPEKIAKGDQMRLQFRGRGPNVNGNYVPQWGNNSRRS